MTVAPGDLKCLVCPEKHAFPIPGRAGKPGRWAVIVAVDHNFPAMLPASSVGPCVVLVRVEDGMLAEVRLTLMDLLHRFVPPLVHSPVVALC